MNGEERFAALVRLARRDIPAALDVSPAVMARIERESRAPPAPVDRTLLAFALGSLAAAGAVSALVAVVGPSLGDPLAELLQSVSVVVR